MIQNPKMRVYGIFRKGFLFKDTGSELGKYGPSDGMFRLETLDLDRKILKF